MKLKLIGNKKEIESMFGCPLVSVSGRVRGFGSTSEDCILFRVKDVEITNGVDLGNCKLTEGFFIELPEKVYEVTMEKIL